MPRESGGVLSTRALNRATLERQLLLQRADHTPAAAIEWLVGLQAQATSPPYIGLWSRLRDFTQQHLSQLITERVVVRAPLMRGTIHMVTARDYLTLHPLLQPVLSRMFFSGSPYGRKLAGLDIDEVMRLSRGLMAQEPRTNTELGNLLREQWPDRDAKSLGSASQFLAPVVQVPPRGVWGVGGKAAWALAESWLGRAIAATDTLDRLVLRYLAAYGPATVMDMQSWSGLTQLRAVFERLRPQLRSFRNEQGKELFDLPDTPLPDPEIEAPPRFLGEYDNALLGYADRSRFNAREHSGADFFTSTGGLRGTVLVDGFVRATWLLKQNGHTADLLIEPFVAWPAAQRNSVSEEADRLLAFVAPESDGRNVQFSSP